VAPNQQAIVHFSLEKGKKIMSEIKKVEFVSDNTSCVLLRGRWCDITVLKVRAPTEDKTDDLKDNLYGKLERVFVNFLK
jgi:hypothetical protein